MIGSFLIFLSFSCSRKITFLTSPIVPAAQGFVKVKKDNNKNYLIKVHIANLAEVNRLQPSRNAYVLWMETDNHETKNIGQIKSSSGLFSSKLKASFETVSSSKPSKIFITAEDDADRQYPGMQVVLSTDRF
jgi:hypothetical protein